jgi:LysM repeat protein
MMRKAILVLTVVTLFLVLGVQTASASGQLIHVVKPGENLYRIALRYGTTVKAIAAANGIRNPSLIYAGQRLIIPTYGGAHNPDDGPGGGGAYVVRRGDTLFSIARRFGTTVWALQQTNHIRNPSLIYVGQRLVIPTYHPGASNPDGPSYGPGDGPGGGGCWYVVRRGDTLSAIGWRYGVSPWAIAAANGLGNPNCIFAGQRLWIPDP